MSTIEDINNYFKLPIYYNNNKMNLTKNIVNDLELISTVDQSCNPIYSFYFKNDNDLSKKLMNQVSEYYTTDIVFLKEKQSLLKKYKRINSKYTDYSSNYKNILELWNEVKTDTGFKEKYYYMDWEMLEFLNKSDQFLQIMSIYNLTSPVISLLVPVFILIIPFFVIRLKGLQLTVKEYIEVLKILIDNHSLGRLFTKFSEVSVNEKIYMILSAAFYVFSIYQNVMVCIRFNQNMIKIHKYFKEVEIYLSHTIESMENYLKYSSELLSQSRFNEVLIDKMKVLKEFREKISNICEYRITNIKKILEIGSVLKYFYELYENKVYEDAFMYSFGFNGYIDCIEGLIHNIESNKIGFAKFTNNSKKIKKTVLKNNYYASLKDDNPIKNTIKLDKNLIITGPNASGKTTTLKSTLINIIFSQQFGCGFYDSAYICPYKHIHCYLNIPDTSGRDSLFQAEARRCKDIIDSIKENNNNENHLCVFDELYSGTNPEEAVTSATSFMEYIVKYKNVSCILTTHFTKVCKKLDKNKNILNCCMDVVSNNNNITYKYKIIPGISNIKGGINVLRNMNYPKEIIENTIASTNENNENKSKQK